MFLVNACIAYQCRVNSQLLLCLQVRMLSADAVLDEEALRGILQAGHSRVPVHRPGSRWDYIALRNDPCHWLFVFVFFKGICEAISRHSSCCSDTCALHFIA